MGGKSRSSSSNTSKSQNISSGDYRSTTNGVIEGNLTLGENQGALTINKSDFGAIKLAGDFAESAAELGNSAISANSDIASLVAKQSGENLSKSLNFAGDSISSALGFTKDSLNKSLGEIANNDKRNNQMLRDTLDYNLQAIKVGNQSESANMTESLLSMLPKIAVIGGVVYAGSLFIRNMK